MNYKLSNLEKKYEFEYALNSAKKTQIKPVFLEPSTNELWVGKAYQRIYSANERIAYDLAQMINLPSVKVPEIKLGKYNNRMWCLSKKIDVKYHFRKQKDFSELNQDEAQSLILNRLMSNIDGNMANLLKDKSDQFWLIDFEYSGHFKNFNERFLNNNSSKSKTILLAYMGFDKKNKDYFDKGIESVTKALDSKRLSKSNLIEKGINAGLNLEESTYYADNILSNSLNIEKNMQFIIDVWNNVYQEQHSRKTYKELVKSKGARCGHACMIMAEKYLGHKEHSFEEFDNILSVNKKRQIIFPVQIAKYFAEKGNEVEFFVDETKAKMFLENPQKLIYETFNIETANEIISNTNIEIVQSDLNWMLKKGLVKKESLSLNYLIDNENKDSAIISTIDMGIIYDINKFMGHHVFLTCIGKHNIYFNDPGPKNAETNQKVKIEKFLEAVESAKLFDQGHIIIK